MKVRDIMSARQIDGEFSPRQTPLTGVLLQPEDDPEPWLLCPRCGQEVTIEAVEPSRDGKRTLTFWCCSRCESYAVTPSSIREPPKGWGTTRKQ